MALFGRDCLSSRSVLSRCLAVLTPEPVETLRTLFLQGLLARPLDHEEHRAGLWDRTGNQWRVFDVDVVLPRFREAAHASPEEGAQ